MEYRYNSPPGWPTPPPDWRPPVGWQADPRWPAPPPGWRFWVPVVGAPEPAPEEPPTLAESSQTAGVDAEDGRRPRGVRKRLRLAETHNTTLTEQNAATRDKNTELSEQNMALHEEVVRLQTEVAGLQSQVDQLRGKDALALDAEIESSRAELATMRATAAEERQRADSDRAAAAESMRSLQQQIEEATARLTEVRAQIVQTEDVAMLQEAGIYEFRHRLADAVAYKSRLADVRDEIKTAVRSGGAVESTTHWTVNGSASQGRKMVSETAKLMLRAYNAEAEACLRTMRPHRLASCIDRLGKARDTIARLGSTMDIAIDADYHQLRISELELTSDYLSKVEEDKERVRAEREAAREDAALRREIEREKAKLAKEDAHWANVQERMRDSGDTAGLSEAQTRRAEIAEALDDVEARAANIRAGWVYVISNIGAFGEQIVKIGMTRRLDPTERVRELGDASVPFKFDTHALIFSSDAVSLETRLHQELVDRRVNQVNPRREFFYTTPAEVRQLLQRIDGQHLLEFTEECEAPEWRASQHPSGSQTAPEAQTAAG
jgi:Meiotically Up-regulated Gene 113 (MUG113) protein/uncharacterized protein DUF4041